MLRLRSSSAPGLHLSLLRYNLHNYQISKYLSFITRDSQIND